MVRGKKKYTSGREHPFTFKIDASLRNKLAALSKINKRSEQEEVYRSVSIRLETREYLIEHHPEIWGSLQSPNSLEVYGRFTAILHHHVQISVRNKQLEAEVLELKTRLEEVNDGDR